MENATPDKPAPPFNREAAATPGVLERVAPSLRRILADNPSPFTFQGTNTYVVGEGDVAVVDPGPNDAAHREALLAALRATGERVASIILTHAHPDHSAGIPALKAATGAVTYAYGRPHDAAAVRTPSGKDVIDLAFRADEKLRDGDRLEAGGVAIEALHTPGHAPDHLCLALPASKTLLSGDHVMGWNTSVVAPPEGRMGDYMRSLERLLPRDDVAYFPGHGGRIDEPQRLVKAFIVHRRWREAEIVDCLRAGLNTVRQIVPRIYAQLDDALHGAAALGVYAHIELLLETGRVKSPDPLGMEARFYPAE
ncbi:MAG: MBL fold metallo-hydrolase [Hyphomicrobiales bacterium]|nr:MBL fold metallo-hydrolase [Hyphomicrobiales bacterium]